jgi:hypothetical protein
MTKDEALKLALEALENSVDLVREDAYEAEKLYGNYPTRQGKVAGLKVLADDHEKAITAIKQALTAPVQEPVAWRYDLAKYRENDLRGRQWAYSVFSPTKPYIDEMVRNLTPLYTTPPAAQRRWVGLTDEEVMSVAYQAGFEIHEDYDTPDADPNELHWWSPDYERCDDALFKLRDLIEAKLKERNT